MKSLFVLCVALLSLPALGAAPVVLAANQDSPFATVSDGATVYWSSNLGNAIMAVSKDGGVPRTVASASAPRRLVLASGKIFWSDTGSNSIRSVPVNGGLIQVLAENQSRPMGMTVDGGFLYWSNAGFGNGTGSVNRVGLNGGAVEVLAANQPMPMGIAVAGDLVFWSDVKAPDAGNIYTLSLSKGVASIKSVANSYSATVFSDGANVVWTDAYNGTVSKYSVAAGQIISVASAQNGPSSAFSDGEFIYWTIRGRTAGEAAIMRRALGGGANIENFASNLFDPYGISADDENIYWADVTSDEILKVRRH